MIAFNDRELTELRPREVLSAEAWAVRHLRLTEGPLIGASGGGVAWRPETFPPQRAVLAAADDPRWSMVIIQGPPQRASKTTTAIAILGKALHHQRRSAMYVGGNADLAASQWHNKFKRAFLASPELAALIPDNTDQGGNRLERRFVTGVSLFLAGSESASNLSGKTAPVVVCDDVQAYGTLGKFGHPADYAFTRADSFDRSQRTLVAMGTAGGVDDWLWRTLSGSTFHCPFVPCLTCGAYQLLEWERLVFDATDPAAAIEQTLMSCARPACDHLIPYAELHRMLAAVRWVSMPEGTDWILDPPPGGTWLETIDAADEYPRSRRRTGVAGFWLGNALYWPWGESWGELAAAWIGMEGDEERSKNHLQNVRNKPFVPPKADVDALDATAILAGVGQAHAWKVVPEQAGVHTGAGLLLMSVDVQAGYCWYLVEAWHKTSGQSWLIECGQMGKRGEGREITDRDDRGELFARLATEALGKLKAKAVAGWTIATAGGGHIGKAVPAHVLVDVRYLRQTVQAFCRLANGGMHLGTWLPVQGSQAKAGSPVPLWPGPGASRARIEKVGRGRYIEINTNAAKLLNRGQIAAQLLTLPPDMPRYLRDTFVKHLCAEQWNPELKKWNRPTGPNHLLDCRAMQICGAVGQGVAVPDSPVAADPEHPPATEQGEIKEWFAPRKRRRGGS